MNLIPLFYLFSLLSYSDIFLEANYLVDATSEKDLFIGGTDGYHTYRIPSLIVTRQGTLMAFAEGRKTGGGDTGDIDLLMKRSLDGGETWSPQQVLWDDGNNVCGNPTPVVDESTGFIWLLLTWNRGDEHEGDIILKKSKDTRRVFVMHSEDDGQSWSTPEDITETTKDPDWGWYATGPGVGIQIQHGPHKGRLVIPSDHSYSDPQGDVRGGPYEYGSHVIFSDDHGKTWELGGAIRPKMNECQVVEVADGKGTLLMNMRSYFKRNRRALSVSYDGGCEWTDPVEAVDLIEPVCQAAFIRYSWPENGDKGQLLFSNPASTKRENMTIKVSNDGGRSWPVSKLLYNGPSAYSALAKGMDGTIYCLYEKGEDGPYEKITLAKLPPEAVLNP